MKLQILALILTATLMTVLLPIGLTAGPVQPPVKTDTLYVSNYQWGPSSADPVSIWNTPSDELILNVYDRLIDFGSMQNSSYGVWQENEQYWEFLPSLSTNVPARQEIVMSIPDMGINPLDPVSYWTGPLPPDGHFFHIEGWVDKDEDGMLGFGDTVYLGEYFSPLEPIQLALTIRTWQVISYFPGMELLIHHYFYDFSIRTSPAISFVNAAGVTVDLFDIGDVEYSIERGLVQDQLGSPMWLFYRTMFDQTHSDWLQASGLPPAVASYFLGWLIKDAVEILPGNVTRINVVAFPDIAFKQILARTMGSVMSETWCIGKGCWNGLFEDVAPADGVLDFYVQWRHVMTSPIEPVNIANYAGTGPYRVTIASEAMNLVMLNRTAGYWKGWPAPGRKAFLETIVIDYVANWTERKESFINCTSDMTYVPLANRYDLLDSYGNSLYPQIKTIKTIRPELAVDALFYTWDIDTSQHNFLYSGVLPTGAPTNFMNNEHVRKAFSYAFSRSDYLTRTSLYEDGPARETPGIYGLFPDYYSKGPDPPYQYDYSLAAMEAELKTAMFTQGAETKSVWDWGGFHIDIFYNSGNDRKRIACEVLKEGFDDLNALHPDKNFQITIQAPDWMTYLGYLEDFCMPVWTMGLVADYADADNLFEVFMQSDDSFAYLQHYNDQGTLGPLTGLNKDRLIDLAVQTPDGPSRRDMYSDLDYIYLTDNPGFLYAQPIGRKFMKYWVKGWYYNGLYQSDYYYHLYKENTCWGDVSGLIFGVPDGIVNMRDIQYIAGHFGGRAPDPSRTPPYDYKWTPGTYGCAGCDVYGDRKVDMRDIAFAASHFLHAAQP